MKSITKFGNEKGKLMIVIRGLYGLKLNGSSWRDMLGDTLLDLGYKHSKAGIDVWMKPETKLKTGKEYYAYILLYVDDLLHTNPDT